MPPNRIEGESREVMEDDVRMPRVYIACHAPALGEVGWYAADLLAAALTGGKSSLMYEDLVYRRQLAQDVGCYVFPTEMTATFALISTARPGVDPDELEAALAEHLARAAERPLSAEHFERALSQQLTDLYSQLQTLDKRADLLSLHTTYFDDPSRVARQEECYRSLSPEDVTAFAAGHLGEDQRAVVTVVPRRQDDGGSSS